MKDAQYYIDRDGKTEGPFSLAALQAMHVSGEILDETIVAREGWDQWVLLSEVLAPATNQEEPFKREVAFLTSNPDYVAFIKQQTEGILRGKLDFSTANLYLDQFLETIEYVPAVEDIDTVYDLTAFENQRCMLRTVVEAVQGYGHYFKGLSPTLVLAYPAWRVITTREAVVPRDWPQRWTQSARAADDKDALRIHRQTGQMIALKSSGIWRQLGSHARWPDALGNPWPPFYFNSGKETEPVGATECLALGIIKPGQRQKIHTEQNGTDITNILMQIQAAMPHVP